MKNQEEFFFFGGTLIVAFDEVPLHFLSYYFKPAH